jgi:hypothetical protein
MATMSCHGIQSIKVNKRHSSLIHYAVICTSLCTMGFWTLLISDHSQKKLGKTIKKKKKRNPIKIFEDLL